MFSRSFDMFPRVCAVAALVMLGITAAAQVTFAAPSSAAVSRVALLAWGDNSLGQLGDGVSAGSSNTPVLVSLPPGVTPVAIAGSGGGGDPQPSQWAAYAIGSDAKLYAWGDNSSGELGNGSTTGSDTPVVVSLPAGVIPTAVSAAQGSAYAIGSDGNLYAWGTNVYGNLGNGSTTDSDTPVVVSLPTGVTPKAVSGGYESAYAIGSDGKLYAWGDDFYGELGDGNTDTVSDTPVVVSLPAGVTPKSIAGGGGAGYAIGSDGNLYSWGLNSDDQLGDGSTTDSATPVLVALPSGVTAKSVTGGGGFAHAIGSDGKLYGWGLDSTAGQLGDGGGNNTATPIVISLAAGVTPKAVSDNLHTGYAIGSDGNIYAWGYGLAGELGDGAPGNFSPPVVVSLPPGSTPESLGQEPGSAGGYAIVNVTLTAPTVTTEPTGLTVHAGQDATFTAAADGFPAPTVQWQVSTNGGTTFSPLSGATSDTLNLAATTLAENGNQYEAVFTNGTAPDATTNPAVLTVLPDVAPVVTTDPVSQTVNEGDSVTFSAAASGTPTPTVEWQVSIDGGNTWIDIPALNTPTISGTPPAYLNFMNGWEFRAVFTNAGGSATSNAATLSVLTPVAPVVTTQPSDQSVSEHESVTFTAAASGTPAPTVEWQVSIDGGTTWIDIPALNTPTISGTPPAYLNFMNGWEFRAVFANAGGSATTTAATLTVT